MHSYVVSDFLSCSLSGLTIGLREEKKLAILSGFCYCLVGLPLMLLLLNIGQHNDDEFWTFSSDESIKLQGTGIKHKGLGGCGVWMSVFVASVLMNIGQAFIIHFSKIPE